MLVPAGDVNRIKIGSNTNVLDNAVIHVAKHNAEDRSMPTIIGDNVTIGAALHSSRSHAKPTRAKLAATASKSGPCSVCTPCAAMHAAEPQAVQWLLVSSRCKAAIQRAVQTVFCTSLCTLA